MAIRLSICCLLGLALPNFGCQNDNSVNKNTVVVQQQTPEQTESESATQTISLFDGKSLSGWEVTRFGGEGDCRIENGHLVIEAGYPLSGVTSTRTDLPLTNYEISLQAKKTDGIDFFCGLTFPVAESHCTFVVGGWAGAVVGLSCIDQKDAANNSTRKLKKFERDRWYKIKVRVEPERIQAWIDDEQMVDENIKGKVISLRNETLPTRPMGLSNFETTSEFRDIQLKIFPEH